MNVIKSKNIKSLNAIQSHFSQKYSEYHGQYAGTYIQEYVNKCDVKPYNVERCKYSPYKWDSKGFSGNRIPENWYYTIFACFLRH